MAMKAIVSAGRGRQADRSSIGQRRDELPYKPGLVGGRRRLRLVAREHLHACSGRQHMLRANVRGGAFLM